MKKIDTSQIVDPTSQQPFTGKSLKFLQDAIIEVVGANSKAIIGKDYSSSVVYVLSGCEKVGTVISGGYIFYNGEVYIMNGANTAAYANVPVIKFQQPYDSSIDPVFFSDGVNKYVHELPQFYIDDGVSGSTAYGDYSAVIFVNRNKITQIAGTNTATAGAGLTTVTNTAYTSPATGTVRLKFTLTGYLYCLVAGTGIEGGTVFLRNTSSVINLLSIKADMDVSGAGDPSQFNTPVGFTFIVDAVAPSTSFNISIQRNGTGNVTLINPYLIVEEID